MFYQIWVRRMHLSVCAMLVPAILSAQDLQSLSLETAIDIALKQNARIMAAQKEVDAARGRSWTTWWLSDPSFALEYEAIPTGHGLGSFGERRFALTQSIDFPTNILFKKRLANNGVNVSRMEQAETKLEVTADVKIAYSTFLAKRDLLNLAQQNLSLAREFLDKAQTRYDVGEAPQLEVVRARVAAAQVGNELTQTESEMAAARAELNALLARPAEAPVNPVDSLVYRPFDNSLMEFKEQAFEIHPRLRAADYRVGMASQIRSLAWGSFLPSIEATVFRQKIEGNSDFYGLQVGFSVPLWFPFRQRGNIQEARGLLHAAQWRKQNEQHVLDAAIESAYAAVQSDQKQVNMYTTTLLAAAQEVYRIALRSYEEGEVGYLQFLEAQQTLIKVRRGYINALARYQGALAELESATGAELNP